MMQGIRNTSNDTFRRLMGNGMRYEIPKYQRDYSWDIEQWSDLWYDIQQMIKEKNSHYMGYLVLQTADDKNYQVIDGQQRLTTICVLILAVIKYFSELGKNDKEKEANKQRADSIRSTFIGNLDVMTLVMENKLILNRNNNEFYVHFLAPLQEIPKRGLNSSEKLMKKAFETFFSYLTKEYKTAEDLVSFINNVTDQLFFTVITVSDELNAFKVFETLNARGVQLSSSDLLKNYIFSVATSAGAHKTQLDELENLWTKIISILNDQQIAEYLRIYWNSTHKTVRKNQLYRTIREEIKVPDQAFALLRDLRNKADLFVALQNPRDEFWKEDKEAEDNLSLLELFKVTQPLSLLISGYSHLDKKAFKTLLADIVVISFRYNIICGKNPNELEVIYNQLILKIISSKKYDRSFLEERGYVHDDEFESAFTYKEFVSTTRNNRIARYVLCRIEKVTSETRLSSDDYTLEHILPDSPDSAVWKNWEDGKVQQYRYRLGNMLLLESSKNRCIGNTDFPSKKLVYKKSSVPSTKEIGTSNVTEWTPELIEKRQKKLARAAKGIWKI